jgi:uncharacterized protein
VNFLFFFIHPSKYHLFRVTINRLIADGHGVKVLITKKDVLEDLVAGEDWDWTNVFPEGRKIRGLPVALGAGYNAVRTLARLHRFTAGRRHDLYVTDDLLTVTGRLNGTPTVLFQDDDLAAVPESRLLLAAADRILAPACADFGPYNRKKIGFEGFKASAYLHPRLFRPRPGALRRYGLEGERFFIVRLVSMRSVHDAGKRGLDDDTLALVARKLASRGRVIISSERPVDAGLERHRIRVAPEDLLSLVQAADLFVSDSQTMSMEAGYLGTPFIRFNDFVGRIRYLDEMERRYGLGKGIPADDRPGLLAAIDGWIGRPGIKAEWRRRRRAMLERTVDLSDFMIRLFESGSIRRAPDGGVRPGFAPEKAGELN